jgi:hypothetical protein
MKKKYIEKNVELHKFYIYTMAIGDWYTNWNTNNSAKNWIKYDILDKILKLIPENYTNIEIVHSDPLFKSDQSEQKSIISKKDLDELNDNLAASDLKHNRVTRSKFTRELLNFEKIKNQNHLIIDLGHIHSYNVNPHNVHVVTGGYIGSNNEFIPIFDSQLFKFEGNNIITYIDKLIEYNMITNYQCIEYFIFEKCQQIISNNLNPRWRLVRQLGEDFPNFKMFLIKFYINTLITSPNKNVFDSNIKAFTDSINMASRDILLTHV